MMKTIFIATALCMTLAAPAFAGSGCDETSRTALQASIVAMPDGAGKVAAMKEWDLSTDSMKTGNLNDCDSHMKAAGKAAGAK